MNQLLGDHIALVYYILSYSGGAGRDVWIPKPTPRSHGVRGQVQSRFMSTK